MQNRWFRRVGFAAIAALSLGASAAMTSPAQAHDFGHRAPVASVHHASFFPRVFFGFGGQHHWHHGDHWDHRWR
jgi:hypothetical protein